MEIRENTGQSLDFDKSYIVTFNKILLFDNYSEYLDKCNEIASLGEIHTGHELFYNEELNQFFTQNLLSHE